MDDTVDHDGVAIDMIQDHMRTVRQRPHARARFQGFTTGQRAIPEQAKESTEAFDIPGRCDRAVLLGPDVTNPFEITTRHCADAQINHAADGYRQ